jgi:hypothetical protein
MKTKYIHVNSHIARHNKKNKIHIPPIALRHGRSGKPIYCKRADLVDESGNVLASFISDPSRPLSCSASIWCETKLKVITSNIEVTSAKVHDQQSKPVLQISGQEDD